MAKAKAIGVLYKPEKEGPDGDLVVSPDDRAIVHIFGGTRRGSVLLSPDQMKALRTWLGFRGVSHEEDNLFSIAADDLSVMRFAERHGLRMVAYIAKHLQCGEDPVSVLNQLMVDAGWDVPEWEEEEEEEEVKP